MFAFSHESRRMYGSLWELRIIDEKEMILEKTD